MNRHTQIATVLFFLLLAPCAMAQESPTSPTTGEGDASTETPPLPATDSAPETDNGEEQSAEEGTTTLPANFDYRRGGLLGTGLSFGVKVGAGFGQLTSEFGAGVVGEFELGYQLPALDRALGLIVSVAYAGPSTEGTAATDVRLPGDGVMSYELTQHQLILTAGVIGRIPTGVDFFVPYVAAGWRAYFMESVINGSVGGEPFGENRETSSSYAGAYGALGFEVHFQSAGALALEFQFGWSGVDQYVLRDTNVGSLNTSLAYRFFL